MNPAHGSVTLRPDGSFFYTPNTNYSGPDSFSYHDTNATNSSASTTVSLLVHLVTVAPLQFSAPLAYSVGNGPGNGSGAVAVGDLNHDGRPDIVVGNVHDNLVSVLINNGNGFATAVNYAVGSGGNASYAVSLADVNGDGNPDIISANAEDDNISVLLNNGDGTFGNRTDYDLGVRPWIELGVGDLNGDGRVDIVAASVNPPNPNSISVLMNTGGGFIAPILYTVPGRPAVCALADMNGDGHLDVICGGADNNVVSVLLGNGDGTLGSPTSFPAVGTTYFIAVGDVNGDGHPDVVTANGRDNVLSVFIGNGDGTLAPRIDYTAGSFNHGIALADLNGDGHLDILTSNVDDSTVSVLLNNGDGTFAPQTSDSSGDTPIAVAIADMNGDGLPDLISANGDTGTVTVMYQLSPITTAPDSYSTVENASLTVSVASGVLANDTSASPLTAVLDSNPAHGSVTLNPDGSFTYPSARRMSLAKPSPSPRLRAILASFRTPPSNIPTRWATATCFSLPPGKRAMSPSRSPFRIMGGPRTAESTL